MVVWSVDLLILMIVDNDIAISKGYEPCKKRLELSILKKKNLNVFTLWLSCKRFIACCSIWTNDSKYREE